MPALTPSFLFDLESNMQKITENEYARIASRMWWSEITKVRSSQSKRELVHWLLSTAKIEDLGTSGGNITFDDIVGRYAEFENRHAGKGLRMKKSQLEDLDGNGVDVAAKWSSDMGAYMGYWPQEQVVSLIKNGATAGYTSYDGLTYFNNAHPVNPYDASVGTYANVFTGAAASTPSTDPNDANYPGACPIDASVTTDVALVNLAKVVTYIKGLKMPNGTTPRFLNPTKIIAGPKLQQRAVQLTSASTIAQAAASGGGGADVAAVIASYGWQKPIIADEFSGFESDTTYFIACEELAASELGALVYVERDPFAISYYTTQQEVDLSRKNELEWHCLGRNVAGYGHPYLLFKVKAS